MAPTRFAPQLRRTLPVVTVAVLLAGCGTSGGREATGPTGAPGRTTTSAATTATAPPDRKPSGDQYGEADCPTAEAVAKVVGTALDRSMSIASSFSGDLGTSSNGCSYRPTSGGSSDDEVAIRRMTTQAELKGTLFAALNKAAKADAAENGFTPLDGVGDEAYLDGQEVVAHAGDAMVFVEYDSAPEVAAGADSPATILARDVIAQHPDPASPPACAELEPLVRTRSGKITEAMGHSGFIGFGDNISITSSGCAITLADGTEVTVSVAPADHWDDWVADKRDSAFTASYAPATVLGRAAFDDGDALIVDDGTGASGDSPYEVVVKGFGLDDAGAAERRVAVAELAIGG